MTGRCACGGWPAGTVVHPEGKGAAMIRCQLGAVLSAAWWGTGDVGTRESRVGVADWGLGSAPPAQTMQVQNTPPDDARTLCTGCILFAFPTSDDHIGRLIKLATHGHWRARPKFPFHASILVSLYVQYICSKVCR